MSQMSLYFYTVYSKTCLKRPLKKTPKLVFKTDYPLMQVKSIAESAILSTFIKLLFVIKICVLSIFEWQLKTGFTVLAYTKYGHSKDKSGMGPNHFMKKL